ASRSLPAQAGSHPFRRQTPTESRRSSGHMERQTAPQSPSKPHRPPHPFSPQQISAPSARARPGTSTALEALPSFVERVRDPEKLLNGATRTAAIAWLITAVYYFYQYTLRSAPSVMMPQLADAFGLTAMGGASMVGLFYYAYSPFSLVAGVAMDRIGPRRVIPIGAAAVGVGGVLFGWGGRGA